MNREEQIFDIICTLTLTRTPCDICTYSGQVYLDALFDAKFLYALQYGAGAKAMLPLLSNMGITTPTGYSTVSLPDIWIVTPMPKEGLSQAQLDAVDLAHGDEPAGDSGKTIKDVIKETYRPKDEKEHEYFLRRFLAS